MNFASPAWLRKGLGSFIDGGVDDYPLAEKENYRSLLPIYILKTNGNEAADFLPFARASKLFYPKSLLTSYSKSNNPIFRLEDLGMKNFPETDKSKFHTATQDV